MSEEIRSTIALIAGAIVFVACYVKIFLKESSFNQNFVEKSKAQGCFTTATLADNKIRLGNDESGNAYFKNDRMKCIYEYRVNGVSYKKKIVFQSPGMVAVKFPYTITVYYDSKNPAKSICKEEAGQGSPRAERCLGIILFAAITGVIIYNLLKII